MKIIQINGLRGILMMIFIISCLFAGFVIFPGFVSMNLWNHYLTGAFGFPVLNILQGVLLWGIIVLAYYALTKGYMPVSFSSPDKISDAELSMIMKNAKVHHDMRKMNTNIMRFDKFEKEIKSEKNNLENIDKNENADKFNNLK